MLENQLGHEHNKKVINRTGFFRQVEEHAPNMFWSNLNQGLFTVSALIISVVFARFAGKELYGQYLFVQAMFGLFAIISIPGVKTVTLRAVAQGYEGVYRKATSFSCWFSLFGVPLLLVVGAFFYYFKDKTLGTSLIATAFFFPFFVSLDNWMQYLKGRARFKTLTLWNSVKFSVKLIAITLSIILSRNIIIILLTFFLVESGFNIFYHLRSVRSLKNNEIELGWKRQGYALTIMDLSGIIFGHVDMILIGALLSIDRLAIYGIVTKLVSVPLRTIISSNDAILPKLYRSEKVTIGYFYKFFLLSFLIPVILYPIVKYPILLLYGQEYAEVIVFSQVYLTIIPFYFLNSIANAFLVKYQLNMEINLSRIISLVALIVFYVLLIPLYGVWGGIISSMLYNIIQLFLNLFFLKISRPKYTRYLVKGEAVA